MTATHEALAGSSLDQQRAVLTKKLAALKLPSDLVDLVRSADAGLGKVNAEVAELQAQIDAVNSQIGLREMDRRSQAEQAHQEKLAEQRAKLVETANKYLEAIGAAESAARTLAASVQSARESNAQLAVIARDLAPDGKSPGALNAMELEKQLALRIASVLSTIPGHVHRLGDLQWPSAARSFHPPAQNWVEAEGNRLSVRVLQPLITKGN